MATRAYELLEKIGEGSFGEVHRCRHPVTGRFYACKVVREPRHIEDAKEEVEILRQEKLHRHCPCVEFVECYDNPADGTFHIIFELLGEDLLDEKAHSLTRIRMVARQVLEFLKHIHEKSKIIHLDLKLENIMYTDETKTSVKVIDLGSSIKIQHARDMKRPRVLQTRHYRAPEVMAKRRFDEKVDIWSLGCLLMEMYTGELLFNTHDTREHFALIEKLLGVKVFTRNVRFEEEYIRGQPPLRDIVDSKHHVFLDFIQRLLKLNPSERASAAEALEHPFLSLSL